MLNSPFNKSNTNNSKYILPDIGNNFLADYTFIPKKSITGFNIIVGYYFDKYNSKELNAYARQVTQSSSANTYTIEKSKSGNRAFEFLAGPKLYLAKKPNSVISVSANAGVAFTGNNELKIYRVDGQTQTLKYSGKVKSTLFAWNARFNYDFVFNPKDKLMPGIFVNIGYNGIGAGITFKRKRDDYVHVIGGR